MDNFFKDKGILITGLTQGIGFGIAKEFARVGSKITLNGLSEKKQVSQCIDILKSLGSSEVYFLGNDLTNCDMALSLVPETIKKMGSVDILVNNAGMQHTANIEKMPPEIWQKIINLNLSSAFYLMSKALPPMAKKVTVESLISHQSTA